MKNVLVVDDALIMRASLKMMLERNGYNVIGEAGNGEEAIKKYIEVSPDIVTMDITMPILNGIEATKKIIEHDSNAKIIVISAMGQEHYVRNAIVSGAKGFIVKPFKEASVLETLGKLCL